MKYIYLTLVIVLALFIHNGLTAEEATAPTGPVLGEIAPNFTLNDLDGKPVELASFKGKYVVLEWTNYDCPFVKKHYSSGNMQALQDKNVAEGVI